MNIFTILCQITQEHSRSLQWLQSFMSLHVVLKFSSQCPCILSLTSNVLFLKFNMLITFLFSVLKGMLFPVFGTLFHHFSIWQIQLQGPPSSITGFGPTAIQSGWTRALPLCSCNTLYVPPSNQVTTHYTSAHRPLSFISPGALWVEEQVPYTLTYPSASLAHSKNAVVSLNEWMNEQMNEWMNAIIMGYASSCSSSVFVMLTMIILINGRIWDNAMTGLFSPLQISHV